jgi:ABC-type transport system involved in multi-copper enzyme maturation permease subunit
MRPNTHRQEDAKIRRDRSNLLVSKWLTASLWFGVVLMLAGISIFFIAFPYPGREFDQAQAVSGIVLLSTGGVLSVLAEYLRETAP